MSVAAGEQIPSYLLQDPSEPAATAEIVDVTIGPAQVTVGDKLSLTVTVKNTWDRPLRTAGPPPGFTYEQYQSYRNMPVTQPGGGICTGCDAGGPVTAGAWRVALGSTATSGGIADMPYRWGLGVDLPPGGSTTVTGSIKIARYFEPTHFWVALIQEPGSVVQDGAGMTLITSLPQATGTPSAR